MYSALFLNYVFVLSVILIWFMVGYQFLLWSLGYWFSRQAERERLAADLAEASQADDLPGVSILLPAHNEAVVIERCGWPWTASSRGSARTPRPWDGPRMPPARPK